MTRTSYRALGLGWAAALTLYSTIGPTWAAETTERISVGPGGLQANGSSGAPALSADGRFIAFVSKATNLVSGDTNGFQDVFVYDRQMATTTRISLGPGGTQANGDSFRPVISADGRYIAFISAATNLLVARASSPRQVYVYDRYAGIGEAEVVSVGPGDVEGNRASLRQPAISADGRFVAFVSKATNLVPGDSLGFEQAFVHDRYTGVTSRVSVGPGGVKANGGIYMPSISANGRFVAFVSDATNLVVDDTNDAPDVFVRDRQAGVIERVNVGPGGIQSNAYSFYAAISASGRFVTFDSTASNLVPGDTNGFGDVFIRDRKTSTTKRLSLGPGGIQGDQTSSFETVSADGRFVAFDSGASNLVPGDTNAAFDCFLRDRQTGTTRRVSLRVGGGQANRQSGGATISADGSTVAFNSYATNLVPGDTNKVVDVFVRTLAP